MCVNLHKLAVFDTCAEMKAKLYNTIGTGAEVFKHVLQLNHPENNASERNPGLLIVLGPYTCN